MIKTLARSLSFVLLMPLGMAVSPAQATVIPFSVQFGTDGTGSFVYDDDNGGANAGFTFFELDFSASLGGSFSAIGLSADGVAFFGPSGFFTGRWLFDILTNPSSSEQLAISPGLLTAELLIALTGPNAGGLSATDDMCRTVNGSPGAYSFCTADTSGAGPIFQASLSSVPEPAALGLFGVGLAGLGFARRQRAG